MSRRPQCAKSFTFLVAKTARWDLVMAAIMASNCEIGNPIARRAAATFEYMRAASSLKGKIRPANSSYRIFSQAESKEVRRFPAGKISTP